MKRLFGKKALMFFIWTCLLVFNVFLALNILSSKDNSPFDWSHVTKPTVVVIIPDGACATCLDRLVYLEKAFFSRRDFAQHFDIQICFVADKKQALSPALQGIQLPIRILESRPDFFEKGVTPGMIALAITKSKKLIYLEKVHQDMPIDETFWLEGAFKHLLYQTIK